METTTAFTHELRLLHYRDWEFVKAKREEGIDMPLGYFEVLVQGTKEECHQEVVRLAEEQSVGTGLLYNNGGYRIVDLEEERIKVIEDNGVQLLEVLQELVDREISSHNAMNHHPRKQKAERDGVDINDVTLIPSSVEKALEVIKKATKPQYES